MSRRRRSHRHARVQRLSEKKKRQKNTMIDRRQFIKIAGSCAGFAASGSFAFGKPALNAPSYLKGYEDLFAQDPRQAALTWFQEAEFGLFVHYGLYSLMEGRLPGKAFQAGGVGAEEMQCSASGIREAD